MVITSKTLSSIEKEDFLQAIEKNQFKIEVDNIPHINFLSNIPNFANIIKSQSWLIYISRIERNFITSDTSVICKKPKHWNNLFGVPVLLKSFYFPLTPKIFIKTYYNPENTFKSIKRNNLLNINDAKIINELNLNIATQSENQLFANKRIDIEKVLKS